MAIGLLIIRSALGIIFIAHGAKKLSNRFRGGGLAATAPGFDAMGFRPGRLTATVAGVAEVAGGTLVALGLLFPLGCACLIGVMIAAIIVVHAPRGFWDSAGGFEFPGMLALTAAGLAFCGPGLLSLDRLAGWQPDGVIAGLTAVSLGLLGGLIALAVRARAARTQSMERPYQPQHRRAA